MICGIVSQNVRCIAGAFGTVITQVFYIYIYIYIYILIYLFIYLFIYCFINLNDNAVSAAYPSYTRSSHIILPKSSQFHTIHVFSAPSPGQAG